MATSKVLRPLLRPQLSTPQTLRYHPRIPQIQRRTFLPNPFSSFNPLASSTGSEPTYQTLTAKRTLPYASSPIYTIISDVQSYPSFLPYCQSASITRWSAPDSQYHRRWPSEAKIVVGFGQITESFTSKIFCVPGRIVESVGGDTRTNLTESEIQHHLEDQAGSKGRGDAKSGLLTHLKSRWTLDAIGAKTTEVSLSLEFAFANPIYTTLSAGAAPKVADVMIKAFEERVRYLLDKSPSMASADLGDLDASSTKP